MDKATINIGYELLQKQSSIFRGKITCKDEISRIDLEMKHFVSQHPNFKSNEFAKHMKNAKKRNIDAF
jgi:hypothetical protein